jgi:hypothetical protein
MTDDDAHSRGGHSLLDSGPGKVVDDSQTFRYPPPENCILGRGLTLDKSPRRDMSLVTMQAEVNGQGRRDSKPNSSSEADTRERFSANRDE